MNKISHVILYKNELSELAVLLNKIMPSVHEHKDDVNIIIDNDTIDPVFESRFVMDNVKFYYRPLNNNFGEQRNFGNSKCNGDWIFHIDPDEYPADVLIDNIHDILDCNPTVELIKIPRLNLIKGDASELTKFNWNISKVEGFEDMAVNWNSGDYQARLFKNLDYIKWTRKLHETIEGHKTETCLPKEVDLSLIHIKTLEKQLYQNKFYNSTFNAEDNWRK